MIRLAALVTKRDPISSTAQMIQRAFWSQFGTAAHTHDYLAVEFNGVRACACGASIRRTVAPR
jgi:hypothetical protein